MPQITKEQAAQALFCNKPLIINGLEMSVMNIKWEGGKSIFIIEGYTKGKQYSLTVRVV
jgi:hypothetical protein